jgi:exonuclease III
MKLFLLREIEDLDVLCIQETWIEPGAQVPAIPGFKVVEQRRIQGIRGGLATYYRQSLRLEYTMGNEYGLYTRLVLPTSQRINVTNVYIPPTSSLRRRNITEEQAVTAVDQVLEELQP